MTQEFADAVLSAASAFINHESDTVAAAAAALDDDFVRAADVLFRCVGNVVVTGVGTSGFIAQRAAHLFAVSGTPAFFLHPAEGLHGGLGALRVDDVLVVLTKGGASDEVNEFVARARAIGLEVVLITTAPRSPLMQLADVALVVPADEVSDVGGVIAMGSTLAYGAVLDALALVLMRARGADWSAVLAAHPGGAVGRRTAVPDMLPPLTIPRSAPTKQGSSR